MANVVVVRRGDQKPPVHSEAEPAAGLARTPERRASGFLRHRREDAMPLPVRQRVRNFREFIPTMPRAQATRQAKRCMDCGIPYCHVACPVNNQIPDWNDLVVRADWEAAAHDLHSTNNFPEITGRICSAPCEESCTLYLHNAPVTIKSIERAIADRAISNGWIVPRPPKATTGKSVGIVGSGPAGLAAAQQLARSGHKVDVFERSDKPGGLLRYGIPDFKLDKSTIDFRVDQMTQEGVRFRCARAVGTDIPIGEFRAKFDAILFACGAQLPRSLRVPGLAFDGIHFAMPYLVQQNRRVAGLEVLQPPILADGKNVVVIGGGDTASDCIGTAFRQGARSVTQIDIRPLPPLHENKLLTWPFPPVKFRTSTSQAEGAARKFQTGTMEVVGADGHVTGVRCVNVDETRNPIKGTAFKLPAELVLIAIGFQRPEVDDALAALQSAPDRTIACSQYDVATGEPGVFAAGDMRRGPSLVVWAIHEGRTAAAAIDAFLATDAPHSGHPQPDRSNANG